MKKYLLQIISVFEMLLLIVVGILSNKVAVLVEINPTLLWITTLSVVTILVMVTIYKTKSKDPNNGFINFIARPKVTKKTVGSILHGIIYFPSALFLCIGAFAYSQAIDKDWLGILSGSAVSGTLLFTPLFLDQIKQERQNILPITIGFILCVIYGSVGVYIDFYPDVIESYFLVFAMISAATFVGLKYVYLYYILIVPFDKWYGQLPDN